MGLPECRAYELVSPESLLSQDGRPARASLDGNAFTFNTPFPAANPSSSGYFYLASRGATGWSVRSVAPQAAPAAYFEDECEANVFFSPQLTANILEEGWFGGDLEAHCKRAQVPIVPGEPYPYRNVFLHDMGSGSHRLVNLTPQGATPANAKFQDASDDFTHIVFSEDAQLTNDAPAGYNFYLWADGVVRLFTVLPDGTPVQGELVEATGARTTNSELVPGSGFAPLTGAVSQDGERIFFYANGGLYARLNASQPQSAVSAGGCTEPALACTIQLDGTHGPGPSGGGVFWGASDDGSVVFFTDESRLTADSTATTEKPDLYELDLEAEQLVDLTVDGAEPADVKGVGGFSRDGEYVYFVTNGALAPGATAGNCSTGDPTGTACSLYVAHDGSIRLVARLGGADRADWRGRAAAADPRRKPRNRPAAASPSGRFFAFNSVEPLTGYDNRHIFDDFPQNEIYLYDAESGGGQLACASCIPDGTRPKSGASIRVDGNYGPTSPGGNASWEKRAVLDDGSVIFNTGDNLLAADVNSFQDVYRYRGGALQLFSSGDLPSSARFYDATPDGSDIFFETAATLLAEDTDNGNLSAYDARVHGGFPQPPAEAVPCGEEECRGALPPPPATATPTTSSFQGRGNVRPRRRGGHRRHCRRGSKGQRCKKGQKGHPRHPGRGTSRSRADR